MITSYKLNFNEEGTDTIAEVFGVSEIIYKKIFSRLKMFHEEATQEIVNLLIEKFNGDKKAADEFSESDEFDSWCKDNNLSHTKTMDLKNFLDSQLFKGIGWEPKTANDYFVLGMIFTRAMDKNIAPSMAEAFFKLLK